MDPLFVIGLPAETMKGPIILAAGTASPNITNVSGTLVKVGGGAGPFTGTKIVPTAATPGGAVWALLFTGITITGQYDLTVQVTSSLNGATRTHVNTANFQVQ